MIDENDRHLLFKQIPVAVSLARESDGLYVDVNEEWTRLTGLSASQALGRSSVEVGMWGSAEHRAAALAPLRDSAELRGLHMTLLKPDQARLLLRVNVKRIELRGQWYLLSYLKDVTDEAAAQSALLASEQLLKTTNARMNQQLRLFESMENLASVGYWTADDDSANLRWSKGLYQLAGAESGSVQDWSGIRSRIHAEDVPTFVQARQVLDGRTQEYRWRHPDGRVHWLRSRMQRLSGEGEPTLAFGVVQDITREREAALALQDKLNFIQKITRRLPGVVFQMRRKPKGEFEFLYVSEPASQLYPGFTAQKILQDAYCTLSLHHPDDVQAFLASVRLALESLLPWHCEYRLLLPNGEVRWLLGQGMPEADGQGAVLMSGFITDITERKRGKNRAAGVLRRAHWSAQPALAD